MPSPAASNQARAPHTIRRSRKQRHSRRPAEGIGNFHSLSRRATWIRGHGLADCQERVPREIAGPKGGLQGPSSSQPVTSRALASKSRSPLWSSHKTRSTPSLRALRSQNPPRFSPPQPPSPPFPSTFHSVEVLVPACPELRPKLPKLPPAGHSRVFVPLSSPPSKTQLVRCLAFMHL